MQGDVVRTLAAQQFGTPMNSVCMISEATDPVIAVWEGHLGDITNQGHSAIIASPVWVRIDSLQAIQCDDAAFWPVRQYRACKSVAAE